MSDLDDFKATYFDECSELLTELEEQFAAIEEGERGSDRLNAVFRAIHSIKGGAGAFGFSALVGFAHAYETLLDYVRDGRVELTDDVVVLCIRANDIVADHVNAAQSGEALPADYGAYDHVVLCQLFGRMIDLPDGVPMFTNDLQQELRRRGNPPLPEQAAGVHNALEDARHLKACFEAITASTP